MVCFAFLQKSIALQDRIFKRNWSKDEKRHSSFFFFQYAFSLKNTDD